MAAFNVLVLILSARLIVLVAVSGGIGLAMIALQQPDAMRLGVLGIYAAIIVVPVIWLASHR
jgi:ABC-type sulfate transport system permease subunit